MKLIVCGPVFNENVEKKLVDASPAAGKFLNNMIDAFEDKSVNVVKAIYIAYPVVDNQNEDILNNYTRDDFVIFKNKTILSSVKEYQKRVLKLITPESVVIFYNISYESYFMCNRIEKIGGKCVLIFADHTNCYEETSYPRKVIAYFSEKEYKKFKRIITLSDSPNITLRNDAKVLKMHGGIKNSDYKGFDFPKKAEKMIITYAGLLSSITGVDILLKAISLCTLKNVEFHISGKGELEDVVEQAALQDNRIKYLGFMTQKNYIDELYRSNIFINPRNMSLIQNSNNFPSKILEFVATGRIIVSTKFSGHQDFLDNVVFYDGSPEKLNSCIYYTVQNYDELSLRYYARNRKLALDYDWTNQVDKIFELLKY